MLNLWKRLKRIEARLRALEQASHSHQAEPIGFNHLDGDWPIGADDWQQAPGDKEREGWHWKGD
jgi:hypothetical protein